MMYDVFICHTSEDKVIRLESQALERDYATVDEFASALANPPATVR